VYPDEPRKGYARFVSELQRLPNVILTPHIGGSTEEAQEGIADYVTGKVLDYIETGSSMLSVNFPNVQLSEIKNTHRFISIHRNVPGMLAHINSILAKHNINIVSQNLKTSDHIGYVITDVNKRYNKNVVKELSEIPDTIRVRVLE
jgi:D-3-phosphoglycerate dehydrogenase / 2-oxoglutarate reductase